MAGGGGSRFWNFDKEGGHEKIAQKYGGWLKGGTVRKGGFQIVLSVFLKKSIFSLLLECLSGKYSHLL